MDFWNFKHKYNKNCQMSYDWLQLIKLLINTETETILYELNDFCEHIWKKQRSKLFKARCLVCLFQCQTCQKWSLHPLEGQTHSKWPPYNALSFLLPETNVASLILCTTITLLSACMLWINLWVYAFVCTLLLWQWSMGSGSWLHPPFVLFGSWLSHMFYSWDLKVHVTVSSGGWTQMQTHVQKRN